MGNYYLLINDTTFYQCISTTTESGAIYHVFGIEMKLFRICALNCRSAPSFHNQFANFYKTNNNLNFIDYLTVSKCFNQSQGHTTLRLYGGNQTFTNSNVSNNLNIANSGILLSNPNNLLFFFCSFYNNSSSQGKIINLELKTGNISLINIIKNDSFGGFGVIFLESGIYYLNECIFFNNIGTLLYVNSGSLILINCILNHTLNKISTNTKTAPIINTLITNETSSYLLTHYNTNFIYSNTNILCFAENPLPYRTPENSFNPTKTFINTPSYNPTLIPTISNTIFPTFLNSIKSTLFETLRPTISLNIFLISKCNTNYLNKNFFSIIEIFSFLNISIYLILI